ncbi:MAG: gamma-glutamyl-phosphate reductase, partial [Verrucomicrobiota bacterium]
MDDLQAMILEMGRKARAASLALSGLSADQKNAALIGMADGLLAAEPEILEANAKDLAAAEEKGLSKAMVDRLRLDSTRLAAVADGVRQVATLADPVGEKLAEWERPNG